MSEILKEHKEIKNEFEKQKKGKENKLAEAIQKLEQQEQSKTQEIAEVKDLLGRLEDLNAELKMKELKMKQQQKIIHDMNKGSLGDGKPTTERNKTRLPS